MIFDFKLTIVKKKISKKMPTLKCVKAPRKLNIELKFKINKKQLVLS